MLYLTRLPCHCTADAFAHVWTVAIHGMWIKRKSANLQPMNILWAIVTLYLRTCNRQNEHVCLDLDVIMCYDCVVIAFEVNDILSFKNNFIILVVPWTQSQIESGDVIGSFGVRRRVSSKRQRAVYVFYLFFSSSIFFNLIPNTLIARIKSVKLRIAEVFNAATNSLVDCQEFESNTVALFCRVLDNLLYFCGHFCLYSF